MKFVVSKTSGGYNFENEDENIPDAEKPCDEAIIGMAEHWHTRSCNEEYFNSHFSEREGLWREHGKNHKTINNGEYITRQMDDKAEWMIEIKTLDDLVKFQNKYGDIIISNYMFGNGETLSLEIYDDYRE